MPVNPNILPSPEPDEQPPSEAAAAALSGATNENEDVSSQAEPAKRKRRTKRELTDAAVVPADDEVVLIEDIITGAKIERPWLVALEMVRDKKAKFADKAMNYAMAKYDEQKAVPPSDEQAAIGDEARENNRRAELESLGQAPVTDESGQMLAPEGAEHGDEVIVGSRTYYVGPGGVLVDGVVDAPAKRRWQRALGTGANGPWEKIALHHDESEDQPVANLGELVASAPNGSNGSASQNGDGVAVVWREFMPDTFERIGSGEWKVGSGLMDKIGLPSRGGEWSSLTVGPITASRTFSEDGEYTKVNVAGREEIVPVAGLRFMRMCRTLVEVEGNYMRGELASFLQTQGVVLTPLVTS